MGIKKEADEMKIAKINCTNPNCNINSKAKTYRTPDVLNTVSEKLRNSKGDSFTRMDKIAKSILEKQPLSASEQDEFFSQPKFKQDEHLLFAKFMKK